MTLQREVLCNKKHEWLCYLYTMFVLLRYLDNVTVNTTFQAFETMQLKTQAGTWRCVTECLLLKVSRPCSDLICKGHMSCKDI